MPGRYKQFEALTPQEVSAQLQEEAAERKAKSVARVEPLDLSVTTWPAYPPHVVVNAVTYAARRGLHRYLDRHAAALRTALAHHVELPEERVVVGDGIAQLLTAAAHALLEPGDELITPWPSYGLYPLVARRAHGKAVPVPGFSADAILRAVNDRTRAVALCNPNDPTGELLSAGELADLLDALPERVVVLLDEALREFVDAEDRDAALALCERFPRLLVFRTFSKAWGLAGLRCGYALGGPGAEPLLEQLEPELGVNELAQAGALEALRTPDVVGRRAAQVAQERARIADELARLGLDAPPSQANVLWVGGDDRRAVQIADHLARQSILVAAGGPLGDDARVRIAVQGPQASDRLLRALETLPGG